MTSSTELPYRWTAPEALSIAQFSSRSDVWSFGCLIFEMVTDGREPFDYLRERQDFALALYQRRLFLPWTIDVTTVQLPLPAAQVSSLNLPLPRALQHEGLRFIYHSCLSLDPQQRPSSDQLYSLLQYCAEHFDECARSAHSLKDLLFQMLNKAQFAPPANSASSTSSAAPVPSGAPSFTDFSQLSSEFD